MSHQHRSQWRDALNCRIPGRNNNNNNNNHNNNHNNKDDANSHFCCICAPDRGDGATSICDNLDLGAEVRHFRHEAKCARDERHLGARGTLGTCSYQCACGKAAVMEEKCRIDFEGEELERDSVSEKNGEEGNEERGRPGTSEIMDAGFDLFEAAALRSRSTSPFSHVSSALPYLALCFPILLFMQE